MNIRYHKLVQRDFSRAVGYYRTVANDSIAEKFESSFRQMVRQAAAYHERFHFDKSGLRRANMAEFPWHFLFRVRSSDILIIVLRHDKRHPGYGMNRE